ncbi:MAG: hypothetical protein CMJ49_08510 [Planctomycetaceae bacterium]|nr:hypothetical protein [Planctomycetaceae bacterium]
MAERKKIAAIVTEYRIPAHADVIVGKFIKGFPTDEGLLEPQVDIVSMYLDQVPDSDIGVRVAAENNIPIHYSIPRALCLGGDELAVDGVLCIGEHGDYAHNEKGQHLYPRKFFFEQICGVIAAAGRPVPVFCDKHLSYNWRDAKWMVDRARELKIPFMAGSSVPLFYRDPWLEHEIDSPISEALMFSMGGIESYGYHGFEAMQEMIERRKGGETGIAAVQCLEGDAVWKAGDDGLWSRELAAAAIAEGGTEDGKMEDLVKEPAALIVEYRDGLRGTVLQLNGFAREWVYAARVGDAIKTTEMTRWGDPHPSFSYMGLNIQEMFVTGEPQYPVERTLLVSGGLDALMDSRHRGHVRVETPHLDVVYAPPAKAPIRPTNPRACGASIVPFAEQVDYPS